jgi:hypothetical protein
LYVVAGRPAIEGDRTIGAPRARQNRGLFALSSGRATITTVCNTGARRCPQPVNPAHHTVGNDRGIGA